MRKFLLASTALFLPCLAVAAPPCGSGSPPSYAASNGGFGVLDGKIYTPDGYAFEPRGIGVSEYNEPSASQILAKFPGTNFVRLAIYDYTSAASLKPYIDDLTSHGIFTEIEDHTDSTGLNAGGSQGVIYTGQRLQTMLDWYSSVASAFKNNPYVGFGTKNEPSETDANGNLNPAALSNEQLQTYNAIRSVGSNSLVWLEMNGWKTPSSFGAGYNPAAYKDMTNVAWDIHPYPEVFEMNGSVASDATTINADVAAAQRITSVDGTIPVSFLETGNSTEAQSIDSNWRTALQAVQNSGHGSVAWLWGNFPVNGLLSDPIYASAVAAYNASSGATGCPASPLAPVSTSSAMQAATAAVTAANNLSVADVANLAAQGLTAGGQGIGATAQLASFNATGAAPGGTLSTDPTTAAVLAAGSAPVVVAPVRNVNSPGGTMPTPAPVSNATSFTAAGDYQTVVAGAGNADGTVSGTGNTINASGGIATISVTGPGNAIGTGPYNDTITVQAPGNTINTGGGNDTIILAYHGHAPSTVINADAAAIPPLASAGNIFVAPAAGTGVLTIRGVLAANDRLDLTKALAGTAGFNGSNIWDFVSATTSPQGCVIAVGGKTIILLPNGSPNGNIGGFIVASAP